MKQNRSSGLLLWIAILLILFWFFTVFNPRSFRWIINILLWIAMIFGGISAIISAIKNKQNPYVSFLFVIWILGIILGFILAWASEANFVGKLMIWMFALWAFVRWGMLIFFGIQHKDTMPLWWWIATLWWILVLLSIFTAISSGAMANLVWVFIGLSIIFDGFSLLFFAIRWGQIQTIQSQIISQSEQNEIAQWDVIITETIITNDSNWKSEKK